MDDFSKQWSCRVQKSFAFAMTKTQIKRALKPYNQRFQGSFLFKLLTGIGPVYNEPNILILLDYLKFVDDFVDDFIQVSCSQGSFYRFDRPCYDGKLF